MEQILHTYGKALLAILITGILFVWIFRGIEDDNGNQGIFRIVGARTETGTVNPKDYEEFDHFLTEGSYEKPTISYAAVGSLNTGQLDLRDYIRAVDYTGNDLPIKVVSCKNPSDLLLEPCGEESQYLFAEPGIYTAEVSAIDAGRRKTTCRIRIPVQRSL